MKNLTEIEAACKNFVRDLSAIPDAALDSGVAVIARAYQHAMVEVVYREHMASVLRLIEENNGS